MKRFIRKIAKLDNKIAVWGTHAFGTMIVFWVCFFYGLLPLLPGMRPHEADLLYWSNWVQLWALPLLMVGNIVLSKSAEKRRENDHEAILEILKDMRTWRKPDD